MDFYMNYFIPTNLYIIVFTFTVVTFYYFVNKTSKGLKNLEFYKNSNYRIFSSSVEKYLLKKQFYNLEFRKFNFKIKSYYLISFIGSEVISVKTISSKNKESIFKKLKDKKGFNISIYEVPINEFHFNNFMKILEFGKIWLFLKYTFKYVLFFVISFLTFFLIFSFEKYLSLFGVKKTSSELIKDIEEFKNILFETSIDLSFQLVSIVSMLLFILLTIVIFVFLMNKLSKDKKNSLNYVYYTSIFISLIHHLTFISVFSYLFLYKPLNFLLKVNNPYNHHIELGDLFFYNELNDFYILKNGKKLLFEVERKDKYIVYQDLLKNEVEFFLNEQKNANINFLNSNCGEVLWNIEMNCNGECSNKDVLTSILINNEFFNKKNSIQVKDTDVANYERELVSVGSKYFSFNTLINKCKIIKGLKKHQDYFAKNGVLFQVKKEKMNLSKELLLNYKSFIVNNQKIETYYNELIMNLELSNSEKKEFELLKILSDSLDESQDINIVKWKNRFFNITYSNKWSFLELENWANSLDNKVIKHRVLKYIEIFKESK